MPEYGHAYAMAIWAGYYDSGDPGTVQLATYDTNGGAPDDLLGRTGTISLNSRMVDASDGQEYVEDLIASFVMASGKKFALQGLFRGGRMAHGQDSVASLMFRRSTSASTNPDPNNYTSSPTETRMTISVLYEANVAPNVPSSASPADSASFTTTTPTYAADFRDDNETLPNGLTSDYLNAYQIQVRSVASDGATTGTVVWDSGTVGASNTEKTNRRFSKVHGGSALSPGQRYQWRSRVQDRCGAWSNWTDWTAGDFLVSGAAIVTLDGTPTGRTTDTTPDFQARYHHVSGTAADRVQVRLYIGDTLAKTSPEITKAVSSAALPGTLFTITAAESTFGTLASGVQYSYQVRARASSIWSDWSAKRTFFTNGAPNTPTNLVPVSGSVVSALPLLTFQATDPDGDALTPSLRVKDANGTVHHTRTPTYDGTLYSGAGGYKYQTVLGTNEVQQVSITGSPTGGSFTLLRGTATGAIAYNASASAVQSALEALPAIGTGNVVCTGGPLPATPVVITYQGALTCTNVAAPTVNSNSLTGGTSPTPVIATNVGGVDGDLPTYGDLKWDARTTDGDLTSAYSAESLVTYAQGPTVTIDGPLVDEVVNTDTITIAWTTTDQQKRRIRVYRASDNLLVHDSGLQVSTDNLYEMPPNVLINATDYYVTVEITNSAPLVGTSAARPFRLEYTAPAAPTGFIASPDVALMDTFPSVIRLTWDQVIVIDATFLYYRIHRRRSDQSADEMELMVDIPNIDQTDWVDDTAPAGVDLIYRVVYVVQESLYDHVTSDPSESLVRLDLQGPVISDVLDGLTARVSFESVQERQETLISDQTEVNTWDGGPPWIFEGPTEYTEIEMTARLIANDAATVAQQLDQLRALARFRADRSPIYSCYRDERGRRHFGRVRDVVITDQRLLRADVKFRITELTYSDVLEAVG